ncbi:7202_t:CDS:2, partial [Gigaspora margarita]
MPLYLQDLDQNNESNTHVLEVYYKIEDLMLEDTRVEKPKRNYVNDSPNQK